MWEWARGLIDFLNSIDLELISTFWLVEYFLDVAKHRIWRLVRVDLSDLSHLTIMLDDGHCRIHISVKSLLQTLEIIVSTAAALLTSLQASLYALVLRAVEKEYEKKVNLFRHLLLPALQVVFVPRKTVDEEFVVARVLRCAWENVWNCIRLSIVSHECSSSWYQPA